MENMKCYECLYKHLAGALSYGKEIISGHGEGAELDHRPDFLGELVNAEHHAELISREFAGEIKAFRSALQGRGLQVEEDTLQTIRYLYRRAESLQNVNKADTVKIPANIERGLFVQQMRQQGKYTVIIDRVNNREHFDLCLKLLRKNCLNETEIILANPEIDIEGDFKVYRGVFRELTALEDVTENFIYMKQDYFLLHPFDFDYMQPVFMQQEARNAAELKKYVNRFCYSFDTGAPEVLNRENYLKFVFQTDDILSAYFNYYYPEKVKNAFYTVVQLSKPICCNIGAKLGKYNFATVYGEEAFASLKDWIEKHILTNN